MKCDKQLEQNEAGDVILCGGEMEKVGDVPHTVMKIDNELHVVTQILYQCPLCKSIKLT